MPGVVTLTLSDALAVLPSGATVYYSLWEPVPGPPRLPGYVEGKWGEWIELNPRPYTCSKPTGETQRVTAGGNMYILALSVYCLAGLPVELVGPPNGRPRTCRIKSNGDPYVYRVMEIRTWQPISDHAEIHCKRSTGEAKGSEE